MYPPWHKLVLVEWKQTSILHSPLSHAILEERVERFAVWQVGNSAS